MTKEFAAQAVPVKYDDTVPDPLREFVPKTLGIADCENEILTTRRLGNMPDNYVVAPGAHCTKEVLGQLHAASAHLPLNKLFGEEFDFKVGARLRLALSTVVKIGRNLLTQLTAIVPASSELTQEMVRRPR